MTIEKKGNEHCVDCVSWVRLSDTDGGIGICDSIKSGHNQHLLGHWHPVCSACLSPRPEGISVLKEDKKMEDTDAGAENIYEICPIGKGKGHSTVAKECVHGISLEEWCGTCEHETGKNDERLLPCLGDEK